MKFQDRACRSVSRSNGDTSGVYLIGSRKYFDRKGIYDDPATAKGTPITWNGLFFYEVRTRSASEIGDAVDIIHCHDSHTALIPGLLRTSCQDNPFFAGTGTLFTIHNMAHQGIYSKEALDYAGIGLSHFYPSSPFEYWGKVNFMKAGIELADKVNTVSRTYSVEIQTDPELGMGLEGVLQRRKADVSGIVNGIDYDEWNPQTDPLIPAHFSVGDLSGKEDCKEHLLRILACPIPAAEFP